MQATTSCGMYYSSWASRCYKYSSNREHESLDVRPVERAWHFSHHENCFFVQRSGVAPQCLAQAGPLVVNMWPYRTIGKTCMHLLTARPSSMVQTADVRWYAKAAASPVLPHARVPVCITSTLRVQTECYGYFEYLPVEPVHCIRDERQ